MGIAENRGISLQREVDPFFTWDVPNEWSLQDAATIPVAYAVVSIFKNWIPNINYFLNFASLYIPYI